MGTPDQRESEPISKQRFDAAVKKLLATPPKPNGAKKPKRKGKPVAKPKKPSRG